MRHRLLAVLIVLALVIPSPAQSKRKARRKGPAQPQHSTLPDVSSTIGEQLARWKRVPMPFHSDSLSPREIQLVNKLVEANHYLEDIFWRQSDPDGLKLYLSLRDTANPIDRMVLRMLMINGGRWDLLEDNKPFVGTQPMPAGHWLYPPDLTREELDQYVKAHADQRAAIYNPYTVVRRQGSALTTVPYHVEWNASLQKAATALREAAALSDDQAFASFLRLRADALLSDDYYKSDIAWMDLKDPKFDIIFAPYETYLDEMLAVKTSYGGAVLIRNDAETAKLKLYQKYVPEIQEALPLPPEDLPSKRGLLTPMEVMDSPFRSGDLRHGYEAVADNLPNDPRIHVRKGSKKIFFKNFMDARVDEIILPLAKLVMKANQAAKVSADGYLTFTILHEISHGLGPAFAHVDGKQMDINEAIGPTYSGLEEAKADVVGMYGLKWLVDHGALPKERMEEYYASYVGGLFRTARFGMGEAHGRAEVMEFNYLSEQKAIRYDPADKRYGVDYARMPQALAALAKELLEIEASGDRVRAQNWFKKYDVFPPELTAVLSSAKSLPVDVDPVFSFPEPIE